MKRGAGAGLSKSWLFLTINYQKNISIIYTPNLGFEIAVFDREREQGRFRGSTEGARGSTGEHRGSTEAQQASKGGAAREGRFWLLREPNLAASYSAIAAYIIFYQN